MSRIIWRQTLAPLPGQLPACRVYEFPGTLFRVPRTAAFADADEELVALPEPRAYNVLNRAGLLLAAVGLGSRSALAPFLEADPYSVGLYCAISRGPNDYHSASQMKQAHKDEFAATYKLLRSPKWVFREMTNIPAAQLGIFLGIRGPMLVFNDSQWACLHAIEQAESDVQAGSVQAALVCSAFSLEDPLTCMRLRRGLPPGCVLSEAAAAVVLVRGGERNWRRAVDAGEMCCFGTAQDLTLLTQGANSNMTTEERDVLACVTTAIRVALRTGEKALLPETRLITELGAESIDILDVALELEKQLRVEVDLHELIEQRNVTSGSTNADITIGEIADFLSAKIDRSSMPRVGTA